MGREDRVTEERINNSKILDTYEGRALLWRVMEQCGIYRQSFTGDSGETAFREGQRSIGLWVLTEIVFTNGPDTFSIMSRESEDRREKQDQEEVNVGFAD